MRAGWGQGPAEVGHRPTGSAVLHWHAFYKYLHMHVLAAPQHGLASWASRPTMQSSMLLPVPLMTSGRTPRSNHPSPQPPLVPTLVLFGCRWYEDATAAAEQAHRQCSTAAATGRRRRGAVGAAAAAAGPPPASLAEALQAPMQVRVWGGAAACSCLFSPSSRSPTSLDSLYSPLFID